MKSAAKFAIVLFLLPVSVDAQEADRLETDLFDYVEAFDLSDVPSHARAELISIVGDTEASHTQKVFAVHDILQQHDALVHVDMHGAQDRAFSQLQP